MLNNLLTRRFIGFVVVVVAMVIKPEIAIQLTTIYGILVGVAIVDSVKGK